MRIDFETAQEAVASVQAEFGGRARHVEPGREAEPVAVGQPARARECEVHAP